ncbi:YwmB family TATA-box binding protein [Virgibacillus flavescens]|uniref:YwmB family TATA-box binding protein n=1 Tax=Virgibacillus flavescens TaxID=1611422 RepID=UPI003D349543
MKKAVLILLVCFGITNHVSANNTVTKQDEMTQLASLTMDSELTVDDWQVTIKENMDKDKLMKYIKEMKNSYLDSYSEDENTIKYSFRDVQKNSGIVERYNIIIPKNSNFKPELIAVITGQNWDKDIENTYLRIQKRIIRHYFTENAVKFTCLTTASSGTISNVYLIDVLKERLDLQFITTQTDNVEKSLNKKMIYGYTNLWTQKFNILGNPVNVNIVITNTTNKESKVTIGTPILITEY